MTLTLNKGFWGPSGPTDPLWSSVLLLMTGSSILGSSGISFTNLVTSAGNGRWGNTGYYSGTSNLAAGNMAVIPATGVFSVEFWLKLNTNTNYGQLYDQYTTGNAGRHTLQLFGTTRRLESQVAGDYVRGTTVLTVGSWYWVQVIRATASGAIKFYANTTLEGTYTPSNAIEQTNLEIGGASTYGGLYYADMYWSDFRITAAERPVEIPTEALPTN